VPKVDQVAFAEELAAANICHLAPAVFSPGPGMLAHAPQRLQDMYLEGVLSGEMHGAFGFTEPPDLAARTEAVKVKTHGAAGGDDGLVVTGVKSYVTGGSTADFVAVMCGLREADGTKAGNALVCVPTDAPGVSIDHVFHSLDAETMPGHA